MNTPRPRSRGLWLSLLVVVALPLLFYQAMVFQGMEPNAADTQAVKPIGKWARATEAQTGETPRWIPGLLAGMPSYGSFTYIPRPSLNLVGQVVASFPGNRGLRYVILLSISGIFGFLFFRRLGFSALAATTGSLLYSLTPYFAGSVAAGHSTKLEALCLLPVVFWALDRLWRRPGLLSGTMLAAATATLAWANHPQIVYYGAIVAIIWLIFRTVFTVREAKPTPWFKIFAFGALAGVLALALLAKPYLEIQEYTPHSIRGAESALEVGGESGQDKWDYATAWSFHPKELISFLYPGWFGLADETYWGMMPFTHSTHYIGIVALALAILGLTRMRRRDKWVWFGLGLFVLFVGFGRHLPVVYRPMFEFMPLFDKFRVPSMIYGILPLCLGMLICGGLDELRRWIDGDSDAGEKKKKKGATRASAKPLIIAAGGVVVLWLTCLGLASAAAGGGLVRPGESSRFPAAYLAELTAERSSMLYNSIHLGNFLLLLCLGWVALARARVLSKSSAGMIAALGVAVVAVADVWIVGQQIYHPSPTKSAEATVPVPGAARFLGEQPGPFRVFPAQSLFGSNAFVLEDVESLGGYQPAKLRVYQDLLDSGVLAAPGVMRMLNTKYVLTNQPMNVGAPAVYEGDGYVYPLPEPLGVAWSVTQTRIAPDAPTLFARLGDNAFRPENIAWIYEGEAEEKSYARAQTEVLERSLSRIRLRADAEGDALIVLSEIYFEPGWKATVNGSDAEILRVNHVLRAVEVPAGSSEVVLFYSSEAKEKADLAHFGAGLLVVVLAGIGFFLERKRGEKDA